MTSIKDRLIKVGADPKLADELIRSFYIKEQDSNDSFTQYWIKRIDEKQDKLNDRIDNLPTKKDLEYYATKADVAYSTNKILIVMISLIAVAIAIIKL